MKLLAPHVPYSLHVLGVILNSDLRTGTLQDVDPSKVTLWSTIPLPSDDISNTECPTLFSIAVFSHLDHQFSVFCSGESSISIDAPTEAEKAHIRQVFEDLRDKARGARPVYDSILTAVSDIGVPLRIVHCADTDPPMIVVGAVHEKWAEVLAPMSPRQNPTLRYVFPRGAFAQDTLRTAFKLRDGDAPAGVVASEDAEEVEVSEIRASDLPFVRGASSIPRTDAYLLSRAPYSVCLRLCGNKRVEGGGGRPVACALMHTDGSIGGLRVDAEYQRQGLGKLVLRALMEKLDFSKGTQSGAELCLDESELGGGALGWNWMDTEAHNEVGKCFFTSMSGEGSRWTCHWTYIPVEGE